MGKIVTKNNVILPDLGEGIESAVVACWNCKEGDSVKIDDDIVEVVTDKATFNVPTNFPGKVFKILIPEGQSAKVGDVLAVIQS